MSARPQTVVVAGASGFIGRRVVAALGRHVVIDLPRADITAIVDEAERPVRPATKQIVDALAGAPDVLVWAAGKRQPDRAANLRLHADAPLACARALGVQHVVYLSSGEVYGDAPLPYREDGPVLGRSDYAAGKLAGEAALARALPTTVLRLALVYGVGSKPPMLLPRLVAALRAGEPFPMTHGEQTRDLVFVDDVARAIVRAIETEAAGTFNIASGVELRIRDVVEGVARAIADRASRPHAQVLELLRLGEIALRPDEAERYVLDVARARERLGWTATTSLAEGIAQLVA